MLGVCLHSGLRYASARLRLLINEYFSVDLCTLWQIIELNLGELKQQLLAGFRDRLILG